MRCSVRHARLGRILECQGVADAVQHGRRGMWISRARFHDVIGSMARSSQAPSAKVRASIIAALPSELKLRVTCDLRACASSVLSGSACRRCG